MSQPTPPLASPARSPAERRQTIPDQVVAHLRREILSGRYPPGILLPPERLLASEMGTNRNTLREALRMLQEAGLVQARHGHGVCVLDWRRHGRLRLVSAFIEEQEIPLIERMGVLTDLMRARADAAGLAAEFAAERRSDEEIDRLRAFLRGATVTRLTPAEILTRDLEFFGLLIEASHSLVVAWYFNTFAPLADPALRLLPQIWIDLPDYRETLGAVVDAVAARDPRASRRAMSDHFAATDAAAAAALRFAREGEPQ